MEALKGFHNKALLFEVYFHGITSSMHDFTRAIDRSGRAVPAARATLYGGLVGPRSC